MEQIPASEETSGAQQAFLVRFAHAGRAEPPAGLDDMLIAAARRAARGDSRLVGLVRLLLAGVAALGIVVAAPSLALGQDDGIEMHAAHELGSIQVALYCGLIAAALWPRRARGVLMVLASASALLVVTAADDVTAGRTTVWHEAPHAIAVVGALLVWLLARRTPEPALAPRRAAAATPATPASATPAFATPAFATPASATAAAATPATPASATPAFATPAAAIPAAVTGVAVADRPDVFRQAG